MLKTFESKEQGCKELKRSKIYRTFLFFQHDHMTSFVWTGNELPSTLRRAVQMATFASHPQFRGMLKLYLQFFIFAKKVSRKA